MWVGITEEQAIDAIKRAAMFHNTTEDAIKESLRKGNEVECSATEWESTPDLIRDKEANEVMDARIEACRARIPMVKCSCGHTIPKDQVMSASMGSSCPDCYDRMSN
jgi:hypothetical protein